MRTSSFDRIREGSAAERSAAARIASLLSGEDRGSLALVGSAGERVEVPEALAEVMHRAAAFIADGHSVAVAAEERILSTQEAANLLNVSRQYLVRLVDAGKLAARKVGSHRRLRLADVLSFKQARDAQRSSALDRLAAMSEDIDGYALGKKRD